MTASDLSTIAMLVSESNKDVAVAFGLDAGNAPKHPSFCTEAWVKADVERGETYFIIDGVGCVAYESPGPGRAYLNRLSVLPGQRKQGVGERLVRHVVEHARGQGVETISIGIIGEHTALQRWYHKLGFIDGATKRFEHLPFSVKYMTLAV
jgi:ribosomal protein S18 acetylase RimI-like enzyme